MLNQETDEESFIDIRPFVTVPAQVTFMAARTLNLGNYESAKVSVSVTMPCYREEIFDALKRVETICETFLSEKVSEIDSAASVQTLAQIRGGADA